MNIFRAFTIYNTDIEIFTSLSLLSRTYLRERVWATVKGKNLLPEEVRGEADVSM